MNKRQRKKREKIIRERIKFINNLWFSFGRRNGKTLYYTALHKMCTSKKYRPFNLYKKMDRHVMKVKPNTWLGRQIIGGIDLASGKDRTVIFDEMQDYVREENLKLLDNVRDELKQRRAQRIITIYDELEYTPASE